MQYADLTIGRIIRNVQTGEHAEIEAIPTHAHETTVKLRITDGPDEGDPVTMTPSEVLTFWVGIA